jgi:hypothetical protein
MPVYSYGWFIVDGDGCYLSGPFASIEAAHDLQDRDVFKVWTTTEVREC